MNDLPTRISRTAMFDALGAVGIRGPGIVDVRIHEDHVAVTQLRLDADGRPIPAASGLVNVTTEIALIGPADA